MQEIQSHISLPAGKVKVTVKNGWITLEGNVDWQYQKRLAESAALADVAAHERLEAVLVFGSKAGLKQRESGEQKRGCAMVYRIVESIFELVSEEECCTVYTRAQRGGI